MRLATAWGREEGALQVGVEHLVPVGLGLLEHGLRDRDARVVDQDVDRAEGAFDAIERILDRAMIGHVERDARGTATPLLPTSTPAKHRPSPCEAPVTRATQPERSKGSLIMTSPAGLGRQGSACGVHRMAPAVMPLMM
jgi:hypothetical protein